MAELRLIVNGVAETVSDAPPTRTLLEHLRLSGRVGTKEGCAEGDCGTCTVALVAEGADGSPGYQAINSCLAPLAAVADRQLVTVEGVAAGDALHPVQEALVRTGGSQCGYCTPGFVMSLFTAYYDRDLSERAVEGNLCRCTGYLPIRKALAGLGEPGDDDPHLEALASYTPPTGLRYERGVDLFYQPTSLDEALELLQQRPDAIPIAGATDLGVEINKFGRKLPVLISLEALPELRVLRVSDDEAVVGAGLPLSHLEFRMAGVFPALDEMLYWFAAQQIKNRATLGGNLGTASPIGDLPPVLLALGATLNLAGPMGSRQLPIEAFFTGYRSTALRSGELIVSVTIPRSLPAGAHRRLSRSYKVGKRGTDDISIVASAYTIDLGVDGRVVRARLGYGGVAALPVRAVEVESWLVGRPWSEPTILEAGRMLREAFDPLSDHRGSASYRRRLAGNLFERFFWETTAGVPA